MGGGVGVGGAGEKVSRHELDLVGARGYDMAGITLRRNTLAEVGQMGSFLLRPKQLLFLLIERSMRPRPGSITLDCSFHGMLCSRAIGESCRVGFFV